MVSRSLLRHKISVYRLQASEDMVQEREIVAEGIQALVMPADKESTIAYDVSVGQGYNIYTTALELEVTDRVVDSRGRVFLVRGVKKYQDFGALNHQAYFCEYIGDAEDLEIDEES
jgi:hypothetical protein